VGRQSLSWQIWRPNGPIVVLFGRTDKLERQELRHPASLGCKELGRSTIPFAQYITISFVVDLAGVEILWAPW